jgi:large subunit ribosomal protein L24
MKLKKNDNIIVIAGKDKGKTGKIVKAIPKEDMVVVAGVNLRKKHQRARKGGQKGQVVEKAMPIHISNIMFDEGGSGARIGKKLIGEKWIRISRKSGKEI